LGIDVFHYINNGESNETNAFLFIPFNNDEIRKFSKKRKRSWIGTEITQPKQETNLIQPLQSHLCSTKHRMEPNENIQFMMYTQIDTTTLPSYYPLLYSYHIKYNINIKKILFFQVHSISVLFKFLSIITISCQNRAKKSAYGSKHPGMVLRALCETRCGGRMIATRLSRSFHIHQCFFLRILKIGVSPASNSPHCILQALSSCTCGFCPFIDAIVAAFSRSPSHDWTVDWLMARIRIELGWHILFMIVSGYIIV